LNLFGTLGTQYIKTKEEVRKMKTRKMRRYVMVGAAILVAGALFLPGSAMAPEVRRPPKHPGIDPYAKPVGVALRTDLYVACVRTTAHSDCQNPVINCPAKTFYTHDIIVSVMNDRLDSLHGYACANLSGPSVETDARVTVTYYYLKGKQFQKKTLTRTVHLGAEELKDMTFKTGPICISKKVLHRGVRAEIQPIGGKVKDPCQKNNVRNISICFEF
jgi:hypothetical protein